MGLGASGGGGSSKSGIIVGLAAGFAGGAATIVGSRFLGSTVGGLFGVCVATVLGGVAVESMTRRLRGRVSEALGRLASGTRTDALRRGEAAGTGFPELDEGIEDLALKLNRMELAAAELRELETMIGMLLKENSSASIGRNGSDSADTIRRGLTELLESYRRSSEFVLEGADGLDLAIHRIASGAVDQSQTVERTTTTVESFAEKIDRISMNAESAAEASERTRREALRGLEQVHGLIEGMDRIREHVEANGCKVRRLGERSIEIGAIVDMINGISNRTDMLALNATIESVRAGEHGRGFAVVAEEIRKLAERTASSTREIGALVEAIQADTNESIRAFDLEQAEVERELVRARDAGTALERISEVAEQSAGLVDGISHSAGDQVVATRDLVGAMQTIAEITHQSIDGAAFVHKNLQSLMERCERLRKLASANSNRRGSAAERRGIEEEVDSGERRKRDRRRGGDAEPSDRSREGSERTSVPISEEETAGRDDRRFDSYRSGEVEARRGRGVDRRPAPASSRFDR